MLRKIVDSFDTLNDFVDSIKGKKKQTSKKSGVVVYENRLELRRHPRSL